MKNRLIWLPEARDDIQRLYEFLIQRAPRAAERAIRAVQRGAQALGDSPELGQRMDDATERREWIVPFGAGAYVLRYYLYDDTIVVIRVWHSREHR